MADRITVGMIGCGGVAHGHVKRLLEIGKVELRGLSDPDPRRIQVMKEAFPELRDCAVFGQHQEMIENSKLDAIEICSPHYAHFEQIVDGLRAGLHVLTEKPMVCTAEDARAVIEEERKSGKVLAVSYQRHCDGVYRFLKKTIESGAPGPVEFVSAFQGQNWLRMTRGQWRQNRALSCGGQLNDSGSHLIDIILWVTGLEAERVQAISRDFGSEVDINTAINVAFKGGAQANISIVGNCPEFREDITIVCSDWAFFVRQGELIYSTGDKGEVLRVQQVNYEPSSCDHNFVDAILGTAEAAAPSVCGLRTIELTEATWRAAETGKTVSL